MLTKHAIAIQQKLALGKIWKAFGYNKSAIGRAVGVSQAAVVLWFKRGRISCVAAIKIEDHERLEGVITKEEMRPDVDDWFGV